MDRYLAVMAGAAVGGLCRYAVATAINGRFTGKFPLATLAINITGCFLIGLLMTLLTERWSPHPLWGILLVTGVLGGYTTFSTFGWETVQLTRQGLPMLAFANVMLSAGAGYLAVWLGVLLVRR